MLSHFSLIFQHLITSPNTQSCTFSYIGLQDPSASHLILISYIISIYLISLVLHSALLHIFHILESARIGAILYPWL